MSTDPAASSNQRRAVWRGVLIGVGATAAVAAGGFMFGSLEWMFVYLDATGEDVGTSLVFPVTYGVFGLIALAWGLYWWWAAASDSETRFLSQQTTPLPLHLVRENDDVWLEGRMRVPEPVTTPDEGYKCAYYFLHEEEKQARGNSAEWVTVRYLKQYADCFLEEDGKEIELDLRKARFEGTSVFTSSRVVKLGWTRKRKRLEVLWPSGRISASGVVAKNPKASELTSEAQAKLAEASPTSGEAAAATAGMGSLEQATKQALFEFDTLFGTPKVERKREKALREELLRPTATASDEAETSPAEEEASDEAESLPEPDAEEIPRLRPALLLTTKGNVGLLVTPWSRMQWVDQAEGRERSKRISGGILLWAGLVAGFAFLFSLLGTASTIGGLFLHGAILGTAVLPVLWGLSLFNRLVTLRTRVASSWAQIHVLHKARRNLFPSMLSTLEAVAEHEQALQEKLGALRRDAEAPLAAHDAKQYVESEQALDAVAQQLRALDEAYPALSVHDSFLEVSRQISAFEEKIAWSRRWYNVAARRFNDLAATFPNSVVAKIGGFCEVPYWRLEDTEDTGAPAAAQPQREEPVQASK